MIGRIPAIQVGSLAIATRASGVCDLGERGVCYEVYVLGGRPGYSFLFEQGRSDGFSPEDVALFLAITGEVYTAVAKDQCTNVTRLSRDFGQGRCAAMTEGPSSGSWWSETDQAQLRAWLRVDGEARDEDGRRCASAEIVPLLLAGGRVCTMLRPSSSLWLLLRRCSPL